MCNVKKHLSSVASVRGDPRERRLAIIVFRVDVNYAGVEKHLNHRLISIASVLGGSRQRHLAIVVIPVDFDLVCVEKYLDYCLVSMEAFLDRLKC